MRDRGATGELVPRQFEARQYGPVERACKVSLQKSRTYPNVSLPEGHIWTIRRDPVPGIVLLVMLVLFALMPRLVAPC